MGAMHAFAAKRRVEKEEGKKRRKLYVQYQSNLGGNMRKMMVQLSLCSVENILSTLLSDLQSKTPPFAVVDK